MVKEFLGGCFFCDHCLYICEAKQPRRRMRTLHRTVQVTLIASSKWLCYDRVNRSKYQFFPLTGHSFYTSDNNIIM